MVQVHLEACLPDIRVTPVKMMGASQHSPCRSASAGGSYDQGSTHHNTKNFPRSRSLREAGGEEDARETASGDPTERSAARSSSRSKSRIAKDARAELFGLNDMLRNVVRRRESRSQSATRVREGLNTEVDKTVTDNAYIEVSKSVSSSRAGGRSSKGRSDLAAMQEVSQDSLEGEPRSARASRLLRVGSDTPQNDGRLYSARPASNFPAAIPSSQVSTPCVSTRGFRDVEESRDSPDIPVRQELRSPNLVRQSSIHSLDHDNEGTPEHGNRVSYRSPVKGLRSSRENSDMPAERFLNVEHHSGRQDGSLRKTLEIVDRQLEPTLSHGERAPRGNVSKADSDSPEHYTDCTSVQRRTRIARQPRKKVRDIPRDPAPFLPVSQSPECLMKVVHPVEYADPPLLPSSPSTSSQSSRETGISRSVVWLHVLGDLIMWKDVPRSTLWFGVGSFSILSASFMKEMQLGIVAVSANLALCYLAVVFFYRTFLSGSSVQSISGKLKSSGVTEADFLGLIRFVLPTINLALKKSREVFSGDPATTLRVAVVLWMVAKIGAGVSVWSFFRFGFFALFTIPKCQSCYSTQLYAFVQSLLLRGWTTWDSFTHKKAILISAFIFAWNISSYSSRLWGGFVLLVWVKLYQQSNPARFEKALADMGDSSAIERIDRKKSLQHAKMVLQASQAVPVSEEVSDSKPPSFQGT